LSQLSRRERQIMDAVYALGRATVAQVVDHLDEPDARDSVRVTLAILERKGFLGHIRVENRNVYSATLTASVAKRSAMRHLIATFFAGSPSDAALAFLDLSKDRLTSDDLDEIGRLIAERTEKTR
jgi:BlaI family transcriptional regulator, penicillinase repressor